MTQTETVLTITVQSAGPGRMHWMVTDAAYDPNSAGSNRQPLAGGVVHFPADDPAAVNPASDKAWRLAETARERIQYSAANGPL